MKLILKQEDIGIKKTYKKKSSKQKKYCFSAFPKYLIIHKYV